MLLASVAGLAAGLGAGCSPGADGAGSGRGVLVVTIDGLAAGHMPYVGYDRATTPAIDELMRSGVGFRQAFSTAPWALPAHASILSSCDPNVARRMLPAEVPETQLTVWNLSERVPRLAVEYLREGYRTAVFVHGKKFATAHGFEPGFEQFIVLPEDEFESGFLSSFVHWLRGVGPDDDWFAYVQLEDMSRIWPHSRPKWDAVFASRPELDFVPPVAQADHVYFAIPRRNWSGGTKTLGEYEAQYDGAVRRIDDKIGRFLKLLARERRLEPTTIVIAGTHGMSFGEGGLYLDHGTLSQSDLHVPLIVRPGRGIEFREGLVTDVLASLVDLAPTLLELSGIPVPETMQGVSLAGALRGELRGPRRYAFASCALYPGYAVMGERRTFEARMPGLKNTAFARTWYGDDEHHAYDYGEFFYERGPKAPELRRLAAETDAAEFREAGREAFAQAHELRKRLQPSAWGLSADNAAQVPPVFLWWRGHAADRMQAESGAANRRSGGAASGTSLERVRGAGDDR